MPNRLAQESSPYLLQHKDNPVDWYPWGEEALAAANRANKPILLSVGYSACHWCHVMAHESFEDVRIAALMNEHFINIKVDREERPDIDAIYMQAVQAFTGRGGWPMTVFLAPDGLPFYGGTYFPPDDRQGMPAFPRILRSVAEAFSGRRTELSEAGEQVRTRLAARADLQPGAAPLTESILDTAYQGISGEYDPAHGGFGQAPKFPQPMTLDFLLRYYERTKAPDALVMVEKTLSAMAQGGLYDQVGGGFHRYATDGVWLIPHFEKMLYDNALLARVYLDAFKVTGAPLYRRIVQETLDYVLREMTDAGGGFYSTQDADSEGEEGKFFLWSADDLARLLGKDAALTGAYFGVSAEGNFEGANILNVAVDPERFAAEKGLTVEKLTVKIEAAKAKLFAAREARVRPGRDDKVLTAWNGLMLRAFADAGFAFGEQRYLDAATRNADFLLNTMRPQGRLRRTWKSALSAVAGDGVARLNAYLEDYSMLIDGLLATYQATFEQRLLRSAIELADEMCDLFWDDGVEGFYDTGRDHETLITRPRDFFDNATPSGTSVAADVMLRLAAITANEEYERRATKVLHTIAPFIGKAPTAFGRLLAALDYHLAPAQELALVLPRASRAKVTTKLRQLLDVVRGAYLPNIVLVGAREGEADDLTPLLRDRPAVDGRATAYLCERFVCQAPTPEPAALAQQLGLATNHG